MQRVKFVKIRESARLPEYKTPGSAGADLFASLESPITIPPSEIRLVSTGLKIQLPEGYEAQVRPRSGYALKYGITIPNSPGTIDSDYRGELGVILQNCGKADFIIEDGMSIAQIVFAKCEQLRFLQGELDSTLRGEGGFGSTGG